MIRLHRKDALTRQRRGRAFTYATAAPADAVYDAAFRRAGLLRVLDLDELFAAAETLGRVRPFEGRRLAILTNGGGLGVLAVDRLADLGGTLAAPTLAGAFSGLFGVGGGSVMVPLLVLWLGYGMASKVAMAMLVNFFPVAAAFFDGLRRTESGWIDLARTMGGSRWRVLWHLRLPAALPALGSGLRVAAAVAPIGAVIGEWVGSSAGLGYLMLQANARLQIDMMFASLGVLAAAAVALYFAVDAAVRLALPWQPETLPENEKE